MIHPTSTSSSSTRKLPNNPRWLAKKLSSGSATSFSSSSSDELDKDNFDDDVTRLQKVWNNVGKTTIWASILTITAAVGIGTHPAIALVPTHLSNLSGGAVTLASSAGAFMSSVSQTGFYQAFSLVFLSEIGDKTFFIAGLLAMKTSRLVSFTGSLIALAAMTVVSVVIGQAFHAVPSGLTPDGIPLDDVAAVLAFAFFGLKTLKEAVDMEEGSSVMDEELAEAEETVEGSDTIKISTKWGQLASIVALVFAAEFGDRSFLSTIALSAAQNPVSVGFGAVAAHGVATGIAVAGGSYVAKYISERAIGFIGGTLFLVFAATTALGIF